MLDPRFKQSDKNIFEKMEQGKFSILLHAMNRTHNFNHGFSKQLAAHYPEVVQDEATVDPEKGGISVSFVRATDEKNAPVVMVVNLYCIRNKRAEDGSLINVKQLDKALARLNEILASREKGNKVGFIKMGTGIAGGDWEEISAAINRHVPKGVLFGSD